MKRQVRFGVLALVVGSTSGCASWFSWLWGEEGYFRDRSGDYLEAQSVPAMRVPEGMETRPLESLLPVPEEVATPRNTDKYYVPRPQKLNALAQSEDFSISVSGEERWLVALRNPTRLWLATRQFLQENGFRLAQEAPQSGQLSSAWQSGAELHPQSVAAAVPEGQKVRVRVRIESGMRRNTSEVFILSDERDAQLGNDARLDWPLRSANPQLDAALLEALRVSLKDNAALGDSVSLVTNREFDAPSRVTFIEDANGSPLLQLETDFNRAWSRVGRAIEDADIRVEDINRSLGVYYVNLAERAASSQGEPGFLDTLSGMLDSFIGSNSDEEAEREARAERYQIRLSDISNEVQVSLEKDANTLAPPDVARQVLKRIQDNLMGSDEQSSRGSAPPRGPRP